jgi:post-segregation antitoxin (ccd killing protein)
VTLEPALPKALSTKQQEQWLAQNRPAICAYNDDVETRGAFSDGLRRF